MLHRALKTQLFSSANKMLKIVILIAVIWRCSYSLVEHATGAEHCKPIFPQIGRAHV